MGKDTAISWTHHTFNPWWGCEKVSAACANCYAERDAIRWGLEVWGKAATRRFMSERYWMQPHKWDIEAKAARARRRVFCASLADVFEDRDELPPVRERLWDLIELTRGLDWLLLTKRPENIRAMVPPAWLKTPPASVWYGTTVEDQEQAEKRIPELLKVPARIRFLSCEPLLGPLDLARYLLDPPPEHSHFDQVGCDCSPEPKGALDWIIAGGESGPKARPSPLAWIRQLRDQAVSASVPFHFKQWGEWAPQPQLRPGLTPKDYTVAGGDFVERVGKKAAGRLLDGRTWDEVPKSPLEDACR